MKTMKTPADHKLELIEQWIKEWEDTGVRGECPVSPVEQNCHGSSWRTMENVSRRVVNTHRYRNVSPGGFQKIPLSFA